VHHENTSIAVGMVGVFASRIMIKGESYTLYIIPPQG
ncbi:uncharacterized protein METZ01_LOCUS220002, partial [marine metagenome]